MNLMTPEQRKKISKRLSLHLRHEPQTLGLTLERGGWVKVEDLLEGLSKRGTTLNRDQLEEIVRESDKQRYSFDESRTRIRANQGHSVEVDLELEPTVPPEVLYHGTGAHNHLSILEEGIQKIWRHHVHLSERQETARAVGARHGKPLIFVVDSSAMQDAGFVFYRSSNGVWLTDFVPAGFLRVLEGSR
jgi:putative RNA 2'-phosphotransferase